MSNEIEPTEKAQNTHVMGVSNFHWERKIVTGPGGETYERVDHEIYASSVSFFSPQAEAAQAQDEETT